MTRDEILAMKAGPELNIALGKALGKALGAKVHPYLSHSSGRQLYGLLLSGWFGSPDWTTESGAWSAMPPLSTTWEGMRLVVEAMRALGWDFDLRWELVQNEEEDDDRPLARFARYDNEEGWDKQYAFGRTAPHAVALAAMLAVGGGDAR